MDPTIVDDLRIEAEPPTRPQRAGSAVPITLHFINLSARTRTLFFPMAEPYRFGQSTFRFKTRSNVPLVIQPMARDGYVPRENDFHGLAPHGRLEFTQTVHLARNNPSGDLTVEWEFQNSLDHWPSKLSNGGEPIPDIWLGRLVQTFKFKVTK